MRDWPPKAVPHYRCAVFLDRDGTINVDSHFPHRIDELEFLPNAVDGMRILALLPLDIFVVSNQAGIALGIFTREQMSKFNAELRDRVQRTGGRIDAFYFCPHLEPKHLPSQVLACECSKPAPGMLIEAANNFNIDLTRSFVIGDKISDIQAGERVGCVTILVKTGEVKRESAALPIQPRHFAENLYEAAIIVQSYLKHEGSKRSEEMQIITKDMVINGVIKRYPETIAVFNAHRVDSCCGGGVSIEQTATRDGVDVKSLLQALNSAIEKRRQHASRTGSQA